MVEYKQFTDEAMVSGNEAILSQSERLSSVRYADEIDATREARGLLRPEVNHKRDFMLQKGVQTVLVK